MERSSKTGVFLIPQSRRALASYASWWNPPGPDRGTSGANGRSRSSTQNKGEEQTEGKEKGGALARAHGSVEETATVRALLEVALRNENLEVFANGSIGWLVRQGSPNVARRGLVLAINEAHDLPFAPTKSFFHARSFPHPLKVSRLELSVVRLD